jgi:hypothetical protein
LKVRYVEKIVEKVVLVDKPVEKIVEVPIDRVVYSEKVVCSDAQVPPPLPPPPPPPFSPSQVKQ